MTIATKNGSVILKDGSVAQNCGCCGGWYCVQCETITASGYSTSTFSDDCWQVYGGTRNPLVFSSGYAARCMAINNDGDLTIAITASVAIKPKNGATLHVCIGATPGAFSPFGGGAAISGFAIGSGGGGQDRIQHGRTGALLATANAVFANTLSAVFSRRSGSWYVSTQGLPEVLLPLNMPAQGHLFHGVQGTNEEKVFSSYSITVS